MSFVDEIDSEIREARLDRAIANSETPPVFDWLLTALSFQGISDLAARSYMEKHGRASWAAIEGTLQKDPSCRKLSSYWTFNGCRYDKGSSTCSEPEHIDSCPVPRFRLRNGRLNQTAYSLFLFVRDIAGGNLIDWIESELQAAAGPSTTDVVSARQEALIGPLRNVFGVSDKVLTMALSTLLIGAGCSRPVWYETGKSMMAIDTLVHNFLHRTGILHGCGTPHAYGTACYAVGGCAEIIRSVAMRIDARAFNRSFPALFPRFVQHAIWRYCAGDGLAICNGNRVDDRRSCKNRYCQLFLVCDRKCLNAA